MAGSNLRLVTWSEEQIEANREWQFIKFRNNCHWMLTDPRGFSLWQDEYPHLYNDLVDRFKAASESASYKNMALLQRDMCAYIDVIQWQRLPVILQNITHTDFKVLAKALYNRREASSGGEFKYCLSQLYEDADTAIRENWEQPPSERVSDDVSQYLQDILSSSERAGTDQ